MGARRAGLGSAGASWAGGAKWSWAGDVVDLGWARRGELGQPACGPAWAGLGAGGPTEEVGLQPGLGRLGNRPAQEKQQNMHNFFVKNPNDMKPTLLEILRTINIVKLTHMGLWEGVELSSGINR